MELARSCHYAIRGLVFLAKRERPEAPVQLRDIAREIDAPEAFLSKIFQSLRAGGIVRSHRGTKRGYGLARPASAISLYDVIVAVEGPAALHTSEAIAMEGGGPFASVWGDVEALVADRLRSTTIDELAKLSEEEGSEADSASVEGHAR
ncbi:MAG: RrF2 family transcriptional regulator [Planctomycetota bacterium]